MERMYVRGAERYWCALGAHVCISVQRDALVRGHDSCRFSHALRMKSARRTASASGRKRTGRYPWRSRAGKETRFACAVLRYEAQDEEAALSAMGFSRKLDERLSKGVCRGQRPADGWVARAVQGSERSHDGAPRWTQFEVLVSFPSRIRVAHHSLRLSIWKDRWKTFISVVPETRSAKVGFLNEMLKEWQSCVDGSGCFGVGFPYRDVESTRWQQSCPSSREKAAVEGIEPVAPRIPRRGSGVFSSGRDISGGGSLSSRVQEVQRWRGLLRALGASG